MIHQVMFFQGEFGHKNSVFIENTEGSKVKLLKTSYNATEETQAKIYRKQTIDMWDAS